MLLSQPFQNIILHNFHIDSDEDIYTNTNI